jgi:thioredoxin 1
MLKVIDVWAPWCGPCKMMMPTIEKLAQEFNVPDSQVEIIKINADENPEQVAKYQVRGIPTLLFEKDGEVVARLVGAKKESEIRETIKTFSN